MEYSEIKVRFSQAKSLSELPQQDQELIEHARQAALKAYAPYSGFRVGAALQLDDNQIITGNNQENAAYPSGLCAERVALFHASAQNPGAIIKSIAITVNTNNGKVTEPIPPCGACRQVIAEYERKQGKKIKITFAGETGRTIQVEGIENLLPLAFDASMLLPG